MELTVENHEKYTKMSKKDLITEIVGIFMHLIMSKKILDVWINKKQLIMDLHRAVCEEYTIKKFEKWELIIIIFNEGRIICDIEYILEKKSTKFTNRITWTMKGNGYYLETKYRQIVM